MNANKKTIAYNAIYMFLRSILTMGISLYASRLLLQKLGVDDYGTYFVVGGIVTMFNALRTFFSSSIQRYLNYAKGFNDLDRLNKIFNTGLEIQIILCGVFLLVLETVGLIAVENLNIAADRTFVVHVIFQLSIATAIVSMLTVPYDALIIANEKMSAFAGFAIIESILRLLIIYLIAVGPFDSLINYALLAFAVSVLMRIINASYCKHLFPEAKVRFVKDKQLFLEMSQFAGWNFLGNTGFSLCHEGINYILNLFGGVAINAARALTYQILHALNTLIGNINIAFKPQTNAAAANSDRNKFYELLAYNARITFSFYLLVMVPAVILAKPAIHLWLGSIPEFVVPFMICISLYHLIRTIHIPIDLYFTSIGELKYYQIVEISYLSLNLPVAWLLLHIGQPYWSVFLSMASIECINHLSVAMLGAIKYDYPLRSFAKTIYTPFFMMSLVSSVIVFVCSYLNINENTSFLSIILVGVLVEIILLFFTFVIVPTQEERKNIIYIVKSRLTPKYVSK